jgi:hypothetical protein
MLNTKFGGLEQYSSLDEQFNKLRQLFGVFTLDLSVSVQGGVITHVVSIKALVAGKPVDATAAGTGNVADVVGQAITSLQVQATAILNSPEIKGIPGMIKPIARVVQSVAPGITLVGAVTDDAAEEDDEDEYDDDDEDEYDDDEDDEEENSDCVGCPNTDCPAYIAPPLPEGYVAPGIKLIGELKGTLNVAPSAPEAPATPGVIGVVIRSVSIPAPTPAAPANPKLCCTVAKTKGYKFCPECGDRL